MVRTSRTFLVFAATLASFGPYAQAQAVQPIYVYLDGSVKNPDGTFTLIWGYYSHNHVNVTISAGPANSFSPAPFDRNQPITFAPGRHRFACAMVVESNAADQVQWTVKWGGTTSASTAQSANEMYLLEAASVRRATRGVDLTKALKGVCINRPPTADFRAAVVDPATNQGGGPQLITLSAKGTDELDLKVEVNDDGLPRGGTVSAVWKQVSGPGTVTFANPNRAETRARFSAPGTYELEISATDSELTSSTRVRVIVSPPDMKKQSPPKPDAAVRPQPNRQQLCSFAPFAPSRLERRSSSNRKRAKNTKVPHKILSEKQELTD